MANQVNISCKQATFLISKKQETKLSLKEQLQLTLHLCICRMCKLFKIQTNFIVKNARQLQAQQQQLPKPVKEKIANELMNEMKK